MQRGLEETLKPERIAGINCSRGTSMSYVGVYVPALVFLSSSLPEMVVLSGPQHACQRRSASPFVPEFQNSVQVPPTTVVRSFV